MAGMDINCWRSVGTKNAPRDQVRCRRRPPREAKELRAAIRAARDGDGAGDALLYELPRGYGSGVRAAARIVVGVTPVLVLLGAVAAVVAPSSADLIVFWLVILPGLIGGGTWMFSRTYDTGVGITADGVLRAEGWSGIRELQLRDYARVTVKERKDTDVGIGVEG
ncbi:MAG: hypothetical protein DHS20C19_06980 [Acidimicrobiales bacterium]|nr:MAG: hypothetical protein DHS20C19_06980 [Acidimicrobiales bacterium]